MDGRTKESIAADECSRIDREVQQQIIGENTGRRNYVIGGQGEAELNVNMSPEDTYQNLFDVGEQCGYFVTKGNWTEFNKELKILLPHGAYTIEYWQNKLHRVTQNFQRVVKTFKEV